MSAVRFHAASDAFVPHRLNRLVAFIIVVAYFLCPNAADARTRSPLPSGDEERLVFAVSNPTLWRTSQDGVYRAVGSEDTFLWSENVIKSGFTLNITVDSKDKKGEGVVVFGNGIGFSKGCLIFNIAAEFQSIRAHTIYDGYEYLASRTEPIDFERSPYVMTVEIRDDTASLSANGQRLLSTRIPPDFPRTGRIALFKHWSRPPVTYSNIGLKEALSPIQIALPLRAGLGSRTALVIGNAKYDDVPLRNAVNDAGDLAETLSVLGFKVTSKTNLNQKEMEDVIHTFFEQIKNGDTALFYFSGHGAQVKGENYLIPVGENIQSESDIRYKAVNAGFILGKMEESGNKTNIVILDACRNNPFQGVRAIIRGLTPMHAPVGSFIAYATAPGNVAMDGGERNGVYAKHLLRALKERGTPIETTFKQVLRGVEEETQGKQIPWTSSSLKGDFYFNPR